MKDNPNDNINVSPHLGLNLFGSSSSKPLSYHLNLTSSSDRWSKHNLKSYVLNFVHYIFSWIDESGQMSHDSWILPARSKTRSSLKTRKPRESVLRGFQLRFFHFALYPKRKLGYENHGVLFQAFLPNSEFFQLRVFHVALYPKRKTRSWKPRSFL